MRNAVNRPHYDTGYRVGMPLPNQGRKSPSRHVLQTIVTGLDADKHYGKMYIVHLHGYGRLAVAQNGELDGKVYKPSSAVALAEAMNRIASKCTTGVYHWVTENEIHWAFVSQNHETGERLIHAHGLV